jgi:hypothetical protein
MNLVELDRALRQLRLSGMATVLEILAHTAAEDLLELIMRRYERVSTLLTAKPAGG